MNTSGWQVPTSLTFLVSTSKTALPSIEKKEMIPATWIDILITTILLGYIISILVSYFYKAGSKKGNNFDD